MSRLAEAMRISAAAAQERARLEALKAAAREADKASWDSRQALPHPVPTPAPVPVQDVPNPLHVILSSDPLAIGAFGLVVRDGPWSGTASQLIDKLGLTGTKPDSLGWAVRRDEFLAAMLKVGLELKFIESTRYPINLDIGDRERFEGFAAAEREAWQVAEAAARAEARRPILEALEHNMLALAIFDLMARHTSW
jgi:hypothetical protein